MSLSQRVVSFVTMAGSIVTTSCPSSPNASCLVLQRVCLNAICLYVVLSLGTLFKVHLKPGGFMSCGCLYEQEHLRPCGHIAAAMLNSAFHFDVWDIRWFGPQWHTETWKSQYQKKIKRVAMKPMDFKEEELVPAMLCAQPGEAHIPLSQGWSPLSQ